jgi:hypothetical protein
VLVALRKAEGSFAVRFASAGRRSLPDARDYSSTIVLATATLVHV